MEKVERVRWTREQLLLALRLYMSLPFGRLHRGDPEIVALASRISRTPDTLAMKACNFASVDPKLRERNIKGLSGASEADRRIWSEFADNSEALAAEAEAAYASLTGHDAPPLEPELDLPEGPTEIERLVRTRRVQSFFRAAVLTSYDYRCALSDIALPELLNSSHIIPWNVSVERRTPLISSMSGWLSRSRNSPIFARSTQAAAGPRLLISACTNTTVSSTTRGGGFMPASCASRHDRRPGLR